MNETQKLKPKAANIELPKTIETSELSQHSQDILSHFGLEAPSLLNIYSCHVEDALIEAVQKMKMWRELYQEQSIELSAARDLNALRQQLIKEEEADVSA